MICTPCAEKLGYYSRLEALGKEIVLKGILGIQLARTRASSNKSSIPTCLPSCGPVRMRRRPDVRQLP